MEKPLECGEKWRGSFVKYDPDSSLWRTHQCSLLGDLDEFLETWPQWGLMRDGECWEQQMLERHQRDRIWIVANSNNARIKRREQQPQSIQQKSPDVENTRYRCGWDKRTTERGQNTQGEWATDSSSFGRSSWWSTEPSIPRVADGVAARVDRLKAIGNGQVPLCAATAWRILNDQK